MPVCLAFEDAFGLFPPGLHQAPLLGFSKTIPPSTQIHDVHSRFQPPVALRFSTSACLCQKTSPVPSSRFLTALPVFSVVDSAGLLHPAADHGIHRVAVFLLQPRGFRIPTFHDASPFEAFPSSVAGRSLRLSCPPTVRSPRKVRFQGFSPLIESVAFLECCHAGKSVAPMGFSSSTTMNHLIRLTTKHPEGCWVYGRISASLKASPSRWISPKRTPRGEKTRSWSRLVLKPSERVRRPSR